MSKKIIQLLLIYLFVGCSEQKIEGVKIFDFSADVENYKSFDESRYKLSYEIVSLEATNSSYIHLIQRISMTDRYVYTISDGGSTNIFDRQGKHVKTFGFGKANNELISPCDIILDKETGNVTFLDGVNMLKTFDSLGNFIKFQKLKIISKEVKKLGDKYVFYNGNMSNVDSNFVVINGDETRHFVKKRNSKIQFVGALDTNISHYKDELYLMADFDNTLYKMSETDDEPVEYAIFNNVLSGDKSNINLLALEAEYKGRKFIMVNKVFRLNEDLFSFSHSTDALLYDQSTNTPYKHPFSGFFQVSRIQGVYEGKTLHCLSHEYVRKPKQKINSQAEALYKQVDALEQKNGVNENPYLIIVSYDKKK